MPRGSNAPEARGERDQRSDDNKLAQEQARLRHADALLQLIALHGSDLISTTDGEGVLTFVSGACRKLGYEPEELIGKRALDFAHPEDREQGVLARMHATDDSHMSAVMRYRGKDGTYVWLENNSYVSRDAATGAPIETLSINRDITERKQAETLIRNSMRENAERERWLSTVLRSIGDGVIATDADARVIFVNRVAQELAGWSLEEAAGRSLDEVFPIVGEQDRKPASNPARSAMARGSTVEAVKHTFLVRRDGSEVSIERGAAPIIDEAGKVLGAVLVFRDASEKLQLQQNLIVADRMASVGLLAAGAAHEINNPLSSVIANVELATRAVIEHRAGREQAAELQDVLDELRDARDAAERIRCVVRDLGVFSRSEDPARGVVDLHGVMDSTLRMAGNEIRHRARLSKSYGETPTVEANESRLGQVFLNVIVNATQSITEGHAADNEIRVTTGTDDAGCALVEIADTGSGIPPEILGRLFTPFFTTKPIGRGTGLGLTLCRRILTGFGGSIAIDSTVGVGTTVRIRLPPARPQALELSAAPRAKSAFPERRGRVLTVDDEPLVLNAIRRTLAAHHDVVALRSGEEALARIGAGERFDVILCDLMMPQLSGEQFFDELSRRAPDQARRVVFVTGGAFTPLARAFLDRIPNRCVEKPFAVKELLVLVNQCVAAGGDA